MTAPPKTARVFYERFGIGRTRYSVHFHDGEKTHRDGSPFFDVQLFGNKRAARRFVRALERDGYRQQ